MKAPTSRQSAEYLSKLTTAREPFLPWKEAFVAAVILAVLGGFLRAMDAVIPHPMYLREVREVGSWLAAVLFLPLFFVGLRTSAEILGGYVVEGVLLFVLFRRVVRMAWSFPVRIILMLVFETFAVLAVLGLWK